jgi:alpha-L-fucosidase
LAGVLHLIAWQSTYRGREFPRSIDLEVKIIMTKTDWFSNARFGLFLHWGLYAIPAQGEWTFARDQWAPGEYQNLMQAFNPVDFDPAEWARLAKAAGMKYVVFTTRHHDGFCMFDSHYTDYKITNTPYGKDVTRLLVEAFRAEGLKIGFYHSLPDWTHPGWSDQESPEYIQHQTLPEVSDAAHQDYLDLLNHHVEQLMTEYGKIDLLFLDYTSRYKAGQDYYDRDRLLDMIYRHQPDILVDDRLSYYKEDVRDFDYYTPEICVPNQPQTVKGKEVVWETCCTMNDHWGYCQDDFNYKPLTTLTGGLIGCVAQNGNLLLNIGPDAKGRLPEMAVQRLHELADWHGANAEAVSGAGKAEFKPPFAGCYTQNAQNLYLYFLQQPMGDVILPQLKDKIESITLMRTADPVEMVNDWGGELLLHDEQRIRPRTAKAGDVLKIVLKGPKNT